MTSSPLELGQVGRFAPGPLRTGELAGHLHSPLPEWQEAALRAYVQTVELARVDHRITYAVIPNEARPMIQHALDHKTGRLQARLAEPLADRCLVPWEVAELDVRLVCLLPAGHDEAEREWAGDIPEHGWYRFLDARERGAVEQAEAVDRLTARFEAARAAVRRS